MLHKVTAINDLSLPFPLHILCVSGIFNVKTQHLKWEKML